MRFLILVLGFALSALSALSALGVQAQDTGAMRAVLVGVSDYVQDDVIADLKGPANDVRLLREVLERQGVTQIAVLADGVTGGTRPTRQAIVDALAAEAAQAGPGDLVYLHFSGHGTRQPDRNGDESDGLDEVFLPADAGKARDGLIQNALVDDEIGRAVDAIRATGADVWLVLDSCHSGTGLRASTPGGVARYVDPAALGVTAQLAKPGPAVDPSGGADLPGRYVAFYSARSDEVAREYDLDPGEGERFFGLFSSKLAARLDSAQGWSFRQLFQVVLSDLNDTNLPGVARLQTPSWDGDMVDRAVFGGGAVAGPRRFALRGDELRAGIVHNIGNGTLMALFAGPADPPEAVLGYAQTASASATDAILIPVAADCVPDSVTLCPASGALPAAARFAQVAAAPVDLTVRLSPPRDIASGAALAGDHPAALALAEAIAQSDGRIVLDAAGYEIESLWDGTSLWFGRQAMVGQQPAGLRWTPGEGQLGPLLRRIHKAETFARLMDGLGGGGGLFNANPLKIEGLHLPSRVEDLSPPGSSEAPRVECRRAVAAASQDTPQRLDRSADLKQCDRLAFQGQGQTDGIRDVNILHIDAKFCVHASYARVEGFTQGVLLGPVMAICSDCPGNAYTAGHERIYTIVSEAAENQPPLRLQGLVETCALGGETRSSAAQQDFLSHLREIAKRPDTRGSFGGLGVSNIWVDRYDLTVQPKEEVFRQLGDQ